MATNRSALLSECVLLGCAPFLQPQEVVALCAASASLRGVLLQLDMLWASLLTHAPFQCSIPALCAARKGDKRSNDSCNDSVSGSNGGRYALWELYQQLAASAVQMQNMPSNDLDVPLNVLAHQPSAKGLVLQALQCVSAACEGDFQRLIACGKSAHVTVHKVLSDFPFDEEVQVAGLRALVLLCRPIGAPEGSIVRRHPSTPWSNSPVLGDVVLAAIKNHAHSPQVLSNAAWAASNIALSHKQWAWLVENHINEQLVSILERYPLDQRLQLRGLSAFINILRPETDLTRIAQVACAAHETSKNPGGKISERAVWVLYIISKWRPQLLRTQRVRMCAIDVLRQDRHLVTFATSLASSVLRHVFNEEPLTLVAQFEASEGGAGAALGNMPPPPFMQPHQTSTLATMAT